MEVMTIFDIQMISNYPLRAMDIYTYYNIQYPDQRHDLRDFGKSAPFES